MAIVLLIVLLRILLIIPLIAIMLLILLLIALVIMLVIMPLIMVIYFKSEKRKRTRQAKMAIIFRYFDTSKFQHFEKVHDVKIQKIFFSRKWEPKRFKFEQSSQFFFAILSKV